MRYFIILVAASLAACQPTASGGGANLPGDSSDTQAYDGISPGETVHFIGTEPFWGGEAAGDTLTYTTPENIDGTAIAVERFAGRNGLSFSGTLEDASFDMMITPGECSDAMSDRTYPFTVTLRIGEEVRNGCAWTDTQPFEGPEHP